MLPDPVVITPDNGGKSVAERFLDSILQNAREIREMLACKAPMLAWTDEEQRAYNGRMHGRIKSRERTMQKIQFVTFVNNQ